MRYRERTMEEWSRLYDRLYDYADKLIKKYDPCRIRKFGKNAVCAARLPGAIRNIAIEHQKVEVKRNKKGYYFIVHGELKENLTCCRECKYLSKNGCTIQCLGCKLYLCTYVNVQYRKLTKKLDRIRYAIPGAWGGCFCTKNEAMTRLKSSLEYERRGEQ
ncbi:MAG: hypothetical protein JRI45_06650 [Deltaproteobacteria bacterium]|nr:hypothetical protein [Deltaproteobacteria bacterium]